ncbi:MAG: Nif3-like dinuclear metal center hexameric protein [Oscillospiraceae bacterium]|nr:Nif3-like dinuclear metal center hexameric protein [Oscillospiraceae bacterium]
MSGKRLALCAELVNGERVCDIGTDHGYLVAELLLSGKCKTAIAADINEKPLSSAKATLEKHGLLEKADIVLSDGLQNVSLDGVTDIVIAGMGGELISSILSKCSRLSGINLVLQPMTRAPYLRKWLAENGFGIKTERAVCEGKHTYSVINAEYDGIKRSSDIIYEETGALDPSDDEALAYINFHAEKFLNAASALKASGNYSAAADKISAAYKITAHTGGNIMLKVSDILAEMDKIAPLKNIHQGDNSGLLVGIPDAPVKKALAALDITCDVVREAEKKGADVIISHHPVIYNPLYTLDEGNPACLALKKGIACICFHSPLDMADGGINDIIYDMLKEPFGLSKSDGVIEPIHSDGRGYGMVCNAAKTFSPEKTAEMLKEIFGCTVVRYTKGYRPIKRIAFCSGGAGSDLPLAMKLGADAFITGDVKHDQLITAQNCGISLFDCGHYHTEVISMAYLKNRFNEDFPDFDFEVAENCTDPAHYAF